MKKSNYYFKFEDLKVYQKAIEFGELVNKQIDTFLNHEIYKLSSQFIRAADSIAFNIAENSSSSTDTNFNRYLKMTWGSAHECVAASTKARLRNYITFEQDEENRRILTELSKMITSLRNTISKRINRKS